MIEFKQIASNFISVQIDDVTLFFSYKTVVAVAIQGRGFYASENQWSITTGRHLTQHFGKGSRTPAGIFNEFVSRLEKRIQYGGHAFYCDTGTNGSLSDQELEARLVRCRPVNL